MLLKIPWDTKMTSVFASPWFGCVMGVAKKLHLQFFLSIGIEHGIWGFTTITHFVQPTELDPLGYPSIWVYASKFHLSYLNWWYICYVVIWLQECRICLAKYEDKEEVRQLPCVPYVLPKMCGSMAKNYIWLPSLQARITEVEYCEMSICIISIGEEIISQITYFYY